MGEKIIGEAGGREAVSFWDLGSWNNTRAGQLPGQGELQQGRRGQGISLGFCMGNAKAAAK